MAHFYALATNSKTYDWWLASAEDSEMDQTINQIPGERGIGQPDDLDQGDDFDQEDDLDQWDD